jgi:Cysteine-rich secretory protein family
MKTKTTLINIVYSIAAAASLTACGGGDGAVAPTTSPVAATPAPLVATTVANVPKATYTVASEEAAAFALLNAERANCGFGLLAQNPKLDQSAGSHAKYLVVNGLDFGHKEVAGLPFFTGVTETNRATAAGYNGPVAAVLGTDFDLIGKRHSVDHARTLFAAPYHLLGMIDNYAEVGVGHAKQASPNDAAYETTVTNISLGQRAGVNELDPNQVYTYPCAGSTGVNRDLPDETPSPIPFSLTQAYQLYGAPIAVTLRAGKTLKLTGVALAPAAGGAPVATTVVDLVNDPQRSTYIRVPGSVAYALPMTPLLPLTAYTTTVTGTSGGQAFTKTFTFTTGQ